MRSLPEKSTTDQIRQRFDVDVERFSRLETGQQATIDAPLVLELVSAVAATHLKPGDHLLDLGCGAGNFTLSVLKRVAPLDCVLVDLSAPMLARAQERVGAANCLLCPPPITHDAPASGRVQTIQSDMRALAFAGGAFDVILAGAVLHHLRDDADWRAMFARLHDWLKPGGLLFVADLVIFDDAMVQPMMWNRYAQYLETLGGAEYRDKVLAYIDAEDSPRSLPYQFDLLRSVGFTNFDILHRNSVFAAYYARK
jgi:tRNA (cmo5U34)-methyltransferase